MPTKGNGSTHSMGVQKDKESQRSNTGSRAFTLLTLKVAIFTGDSPRAHFFRTAGLDVRKAEAAEPRLKIAAPCRSNLGGSLGRF
jgi:hypothetical protein